MVRERKSNRDSSSTKSSLQSNLVVGPPFTAGRANELQTITDSTTQREISGRRFNEDIPPLLGEGEDTPPRADQQKAKSRKVRARKQARLADSIPVRKSRSRPMSANPLSQSCGNTPVDILRAYGEYD